MRDLVSENPSNRRRLIESFHKDGFCGPITVLSPGRCKTLLDSIPRQPNARQVWLKGLAVTESSIFAQAVRPQLIGLVREIIGDDIILWGASIVSRPPDARHPWHSDAECSVPGGRFVSVWVGLENTSRESGLEFVRGSHKVGKPIQQIAASKSTDRESIFAETAVDWACEENPDAALEQPDITDGQAILFDGRVWHSSNNRRPEGVRSALLLQYASGDTPIRIPEPGGYEWPFQFSETMRPPVISVSGAASAETNVVVAPPTRHGQRKQLVTAIEHLNTPLPGDPVKRWKPYRLFDGETDILKNLTCHTSVLHPGFSPHPPHAHAEEEILIVLEGEAEIVIAHDESGDAARVEHMTPGSLVYYPAYQYHTIRNVSGEPVNYLMLKWWAASAPPGDPLGVEVIKPEFVRADDTGRRFAAEVLFEHSTAYLGKLHAHLTTLRPGGGYEPHADEYDVAIIMLSGEVETLDQIVRPLGAVFYAAGELHGMRNYSDEPARYLVFEFHRYRYQAENDLWRRMRAVMSALVPARG